jgi:hypothetical protein
MDTALAHLVPVAADTGSAADVARGILGELLFHRGEWGALADSPGGAAPLFSTFARAAPEEWVFSEASAAVPLHPTSVGTPTVDVEVNGVTHAFWIDTGAGLTVLSSELAERAGVSVGEPGARAGTSTSREVPARPAVLAELRVGPALVRNHPVAVIEAADLRFPMPDGGDEVEIHGILGWPAIRNLDLTLDYPRGRLIIREPAPRDVTERNLFWLGYPAVAAYAESGRPLLLGLDTGASASWLSAGYLHAAGVRPEAARDRRIGGAGGFETIAVGTLGSATVWIDPWRIGFRDIDVHDEVGVTSSLDLDGVLGSDILRGRAVRIDFYNGRLEILHGSG